MFAMDQEARNSCSVRDDEAQDTVRDDEAQDTFSDATFSDMRIAYHSVSKELRNQTQKSERMSKENHIIRLLANFLEDPDIRARWEVMETNDISNQESQDGN